MSCSKKSCKACDVSFGHCCGSECYFLSKSFAFTVLCSCRPKVGHLAPFFSIELFGVSITEYHSHTGRLGISASSHIGSEDILLVNVQLRSAQTMPFSS
jgi:hypothetical protein